MEDALARSKDEVRQLKETIAVLRAELEKQAFAFEERLDKERSSHRDEKKHLHATIETLRAKLEERVSR
jgi:hypothetical protein